MRQEEPIELINRTEYDEGMKSWYTINNKDFFFNFKSYERLPSGLYSITYSQTDGVGLSKMEYNSDEFFVLPSLPHTDILNDINKFWDSADKFSQYNLTHKRGVILHGEPGCGKSSLIYLMIEEIKKNDGLAINFTDPGLWIMLSTMLRQVENDRPVLCIIEDIDLIITRYGEENFLAFLDGLNSIEHVLYVATTNNLELIPGRIKDRPSRFDKKYEIKKPTDNDRKFYFETILKGDDIKKYDIDKLVKDTKNFTMAHLKEMFISLYILDHNYNTVIKNLKNAKLAEKSIGFNLSEEEY